MRSIWLLLMLPLLMGMTPVERDYTVDHKDCPGGGRAVYIKKGLFLTAYHVVDTCTPLICAKEAEVVAYNEDEDWALLRCELEGMPEDWRPGAVVDWDSPDVADTCYYIVDGYKFPVAFKYKDYQDHWVFTGTQPVLGHSGAGVYNQNDELVGIVIARYNNVEKGQACSAIFAETAIERRLIEPQKEPEPQKPG